MRIGYLRQLEKSKEQWYQAHGEEPPQLAFTAKPKKKKIAADTNTYTDTYIMPVFSPSKSTPCPPKDLSLWEGDGAGIEPDEFSRAIQALRQTKVCSPHKGTFKQKKGHVNDCFTPYENDIASYEAFEVTRNELKRNAESIACEMDRVQSEWARPPKENWFCEKGPQFSVEFARFMQLERRKAAIEAYESRLSKTH